ncbi:Far10p ASCRUDRAFT_21123, partial [Ascoidea rubescens DSM 1968]
PPTSSLLAPINDLKSLSRSQYQYNIILSSLNDSFEKKSLMIPFYPETLKLGRPAGIKVKPTQTNGYFDSRVLSRNHAQLYAEKSSGKIFIKDLGSSNGTFVNQNKISTDHNLSPCEIKVGDQIDLGFDIETHLNHRKISAKVESLTLIPLFNNKNINNNNNNLFNVNSPNDLFQNSILNNAFDSALFGDILPAYEDNAINFKNELMTGLSINSNLSTSSTLEYQIRTLINEIHLIKVSNLKLKSVENFLIHYKKNLSSFQKKKDELNNKNLRNAENKIFKKLEKNFQENYQEKFLKISKDLQSKDNIINNLKFKISDDLKSVNNLNDSIRFLNNKIVV